MEKLKDTFYIDIYDKTVNIGMCDDEDFLEQWYYEITDNQHDSELFPAVALTFYGDDGEYWILYTIDDFDINSCSHEIFHLTHFLMNDINQSFDLNNHETHAWLHGYLVDKIYIIVNNLIKNK